MVNWNSVKEKLPEESEMVLVYDSTPYANSYGPSVQFGRYNKDKKEWKTWMIHIDTDVGLEYMPIISTVESDWFIVTHWAEMPKFEED